MGQLVGEGGGVALGVAEGLERRHLHVVGTLGIIGARPAVPDIGAGAGEEPVRLREAIERGEGRGLRPRR